MKYTKEILKLITESGSDGIKEDRLAVALKIKIHQVRRVIRRLYSRKLIFRNLSMNTWKIVKFRTAEEVDYNKKMEWSAG